MSETIANNMALVIEENVRHKVVVTTEYKGYEVQALQVEIIDNHLRVYYYTPGPDYASREAMLIIDLPVKELLRSLEVTDDD